ncbi:MAG: DUF5067 domain-containing protein [Romboutsia sp.]|nr:DUF5067 domain-containing protein [Romboutsia sp.]
MHKRVISLFIITALNLNFLVGCDKINEIKNIKSNDEIKVNSTKENIVDEIRVNIESIDKQKDYEQKDTLILDISFKNLSNEIKIIDSQDITVTQSSYQLKNTYDESLNTEAFYIELKPNEKQTFKVGYKLEGDNDDIKLIYKPFLSKNKLQIELNELNKK